MEQVRETKPESKGKEAWGGRKEKAWQGEKSKICKGGHHEHSHNGSRRVKKKTKKGF